MEVSFVFFASAEDVKRFSEKTLIVKNDIGVITEFDGRKIDGIAFPTTSNLYNSGTGAIATVSRRTGDRHSVRQQVFPYYNVASSVRVTSLFGAGVDNRIDAVGSSVSTPPCYRAFEATYTCVMEAAQRENLTCLAIGSISAANCGRRASGPTSDPAIPVERDVVGRRGHRM